MHYTTFDEDWAYQAAPCLILGFLVFCAFLALAIFASHAWVLGAAFTAGVMTPYLVRWYRIFFSI